MSDYTTRRWYFLCEGHDISVGESLTDLLNSVEADDVAGGTFLLFDATGQQYSLTLAGREVHAAQAGSSQSGVQELREILMEVLLRSGLGRELTVTLSTEDLVAKAVAILVEEKSRGTNLFMRLFRWFGLSK